MRLKTVTGRKRTPLLRSTNDTPVACYLIETLVGKHAFVAHTSTRRIVATEVDGL